MITIGQFKLNDQDDIRQNTELYILLGKKNPMMCGIRDHNQFIQRTQGKTKMDTCHFLFESEQPAYTTPFNQVAWDVIAHFDEEPITDYRKGQLKTVVQALSDGFSQREIQKQYNIGQSIVSGIVKDMRGFLEHEYDDDPRVMDQPNKKRTGRPRKLN